MKPKIVKRNSEKKIQKLYKGNRSAKNILQNALSDAHKLQAVVVIATMDNGDIATGWSKGMTNRVARTCRIW